MAEGVRRLHAVRLAIDGGDNRGTQLVVDGAQSLGHFLAEAVALLLDLVRLLEPLVDVRGVEHRLPERLGGRDEILEAEALELDVALQVLGRLEQVAAADELGDGADAELGHDLAALLGDHEEVVDDVLRLAGELGAQLGVLRRDADGARVQVALAHHDAAHGNQRRRGEAEHFGAEARSNGHVHAVAQAAVGLKRHAPAKPIEHQRLVRLGNAELEGQARVLDAGPA